MRIALTLAAAAGVAACSRTPLDLGLARSGLRALPAIPPHASGLTRAATAADDFILGQFFSLQCHTEDGHSVNDCPPGVPVDNSTRYTSQSLLGLVAAVDREVYDVFDASATGCSAGDGARAFTCSPGSFVCTDGGMPTRYMLDMFSQVGCVAHRTTPAAKFYAYSTGDSPRALIATRKHDTFSAGMDQSDIYQIVVTRTASGTNRLLGFNQTSIESVSGYSERVVLLVNFETRRFMVQYRQQGAQAFVTAAGKGGLTAAGAYEPGAFWVRTKTTAGACFDNATRAAIDASNCAAEQQAWSSAADAAAYLDATAAEQTQLASFLARFSGGATARDMGVDEAPSSGTDASNFPDRIE